MGNEEKSSYKRAAATILREVQKPMHYRELTKIALERGLIKTRGKTPEATMNAQLIVDVNYKRERSAFIKTSAGTFTLNPEIEK